jgi:hypothetical protein
VDLTLYQRELRGEAESPNLGGLLDVETLAGFVVL